MKSSKREPEPSPGLLRALRGRIFAHAVHHLADLDARTFAGIARYDLLENAKFGGPTGVDRDHLLAVLRDPAHPDRLTRLEGPLVLRSTPHAPSRRIVLSAVDALVFPDGAVRVAALEHLLRLNELAIPYLTAKSQKLLAQWADGVRSSDEAVWQQAAIPIHDSLQDDWLLNLAAARQAVEANFEHGVREYFGRVLEPEIRAIDSIDIRWWDPRRQRDELIERIVEIAAQSADLHEAANTFLREFGHLPLARELSMWRLVNEWLGHHAAAEGTIGQGLRTWFESVGTPLASYHVIQTFLGEPKWFAGSEVWAWSEVGTLLSWSKTEGPKGREGKLWRAFCLLGQHYCHHLEARLPLNDGERIAISAWWLAARVSEALVGNSDLADSICEDIVPVETEHSGQVWQLCRPSISPSELRTATILCKSIWALSTLCEMATALSSGAETAIPEAEKETIGSAIGGAVLMWFPPAPPSTREPVYAFDPTIAASALEWGRVFASGDVPPFSSLVAFLRNLSEPEQLIESLRNILKEEAHNQAVITHLLRVFAYLADARAEAVWNLLEDVKWRDAIFRQVDSSALGLLFDSLMEIEIHRGGKWSTHVPHYFALACEGSPDDEDRQLLLFSLTASFCLHTGTVSAVQRLIHGQQIAGIAKPLARWSAELQKMQQVTPRWIATRIGALLAVLHESALPTNGAGH